jgi:hypothetical protein
MMKISSSYKKKFFHKKKLSLTIVFLICEESVFLNELTFRVRFIILLILSPAILSPFTLF